MASYKHILITTDGSELAAKGVEHGLALAKALAEKVTLFTATQPFPFPPYIGADVWTPLPGDIEDFEVAQKRAADKLLETVMAQAKKAGVKADARQVAHASAAEAIVETAGAAGCDLIVMASHGRRGLGRLVLGSETAEVVAHSPVPVLVVR